MQNMCLHSYAHRLGPLMLVLRKRHRETSHGACEYLTLWRRASKMRSRKRPHAAPEDDAVGQAPEETRREHGTMMIRSSA